MKKGLFCFAILFIFVNLSAQTIDLEESITLARKLQAEGKLKQAIEVMEQAVESHPASGEAYLHLGLAWGALGQHGGNTGDFAAAMQGVNEGFAAFNRAAELDPGNLDVHLTYGAWGINVPSFFNKLHEGVDHLETALQLAQELSDPDAVAKQTNIYGLLGQGYKLQDRYAEARDAFSNVLKRIETGESAETARTELKFLEGKETVAENVEEGPSSPEIRKLEKTIAESPEDFDLLYALGRAYFEQEAWPRATATLKKAMKVNPNHAEAQFLLATAVAMDASMGYDDRVYVNTDVRTHLAMEGARQAERAYELDPDNPEVSIFYAAMLVEMPFFVGGIEKGIALLEALAEDDRVSESIREEALYRVGFAYRKKGHAVWMKMLKDYPGSDQIQNVYEEYGLRESSNSSGPVSGERAVITFHLGFMDELPPQTGLWVEDAEGRFVRTLYVSGFSGFAKEKQVNLPEWAKSSSFETDGTTTASIEWGKNVFVWDLKDRKGRRIKNGKYRIRLETAWWPSMKYGRSAIEIEIGKETEKTVEKPPFIPRLHIQVLE